MIDHEVAWFLPSLTPNTGSNRLNRGTPGWQIVHERYCAIPYASSKEPLFCCLCLRLFTSIIMLVEILSPCQAFVWGSEHVLHG